LDVGFRLDHREALVASTEIAMKSKGLYLVTDDLPSDVVERDRFLLEAMDRRILARSTA
jgi:hypothetical protein